MNFFKAFILLVCVVGLAPAFGDATKEENFLKSLHLEEYKLSYLDEAGNTISLAQLLERSKGKTINITKNPERKTASIALSSASAVVEEQDNAAAKSSHWDLLHIKDLNGRFIKSNREKPTLVSFYFSECAPCIDEIPQLNAFKQQHPEVDVVALTFDDEGISKSFVAKFGLSWPIVAGAEDLITRFGVKIYPSFALLNGDGNLVKVTTGHKLSEGKSLDVQTLHKWVTQ